MRRLGGALAVAVMAVFTVLPWATAQQVSGRADQKFTTDMPGASTGFILSELFPDGPDGQVKAHRATRIEFPPGTQLTGAIEESCQASDAEFRQHGLSACPAESKIGQGTVEVQTTGTPTSSPPATLDVTAFGVSKPRDDPSVEAGVRLAFSSNGAVTSTALIKNEGRIQTESTTPNCVPPGQPPDCPFGEFAPKRLQIDVPARTKTIGGVVRNGATTPPTCPPGGAWTMRHTHTYADGSTELFVNDLPCKAIPPRPLKVAIAPGKVRAGRRVKLAVTVTSDGTAVRAARIRVGRRLVRTGDDGQARVTMRVSRPGVHTVRASAAGYLRASATFRARR
jgi:hypothetical protein